LIVLNPKMIIIMIIVVKKIIGMDLAIHNYLSISWHTWISRGLKKDRLSTQTNCKGKILFLMIKKKNKRTINIFLFYIVSFLNLCSYYGILFFIFFSAFYHFGHISPNIIRKIFLILFSFFWLTMTQIVI